MIVSEVEDTFYINFTLHESDQLEVVHSHIVQSFSTDIANHVNSLITRIKKDRIN